MLRREFLAAAASVAVASAAPSSAAPVKLGIDLFSLRSQNWTPSQYLNYCASQRVKVVHFSEVRFIRSLDPENLKSVRAEAERLGLELEIGMKSICPTSTMFDATQGTAEQQLTRMIDSATVVGSKIVRAVLGSADDRKNGAIDKHIEDTVRVLRAVRSKAQDANIRIAIENHAGDMQARELKSLVEGAGTDVVGVCLDSGNPLWTLEDPHLTLEVLHPYVLTSHVRDSAVWTIPEGAAVSWVSMGQGNVGIDQYVKRFAELCPGKALSMETIIFGPRKFPFRQPAFWDAYRTTPAWEFERFLEIADRGAPRAEEKWESADESTRQRKALEASLAYTRQILGMS